MTLWRLQNFKSILISKCAFVKMQRKAGKLRQHPKPGSEGGGACTCAVRVVKVVIAPTAVSQKGQINAE